MLMRAGMCRVLSRRKLGPAKITCPLQLLVLCWVGRVILSSHLFFPCEDGDNAASERYLRSLAFT